VEVRPDPAGRAHLRQAVDPDLNRPYPFTAIVGQERLKRALLLNAVNPSIGGVLVEGPSGTAKSTAVRGLAALLPELDVVADCPFSCDPAAPCEVCAARTDERPVARRRARIVTLPLNATDDRVAGSVDIARALREGVAALEPGLLAEVNRGILYVDEINLLDDHLADLLLDAAALGVNTVEREGVSVAHPSRFLLVGTMNPEEGDLRPQLADRIGLRVVVDALAAADERAEVLRRREGYTDDADGFHTAWDAEEAALSARVAAAQERLPGVSVPDDLYAGIARVVTRSGVASHRADVAILQCAKAQAALDGRDEIGREDVHAAAGLALGHRVPVDPFDPQSGLDDRLLRRIVDEVLDEDAAEKKAAAPASPAS
jgi:Mg-chelatase subunit ChlI